MKAPLRQEVIVIPTEDGGLDLFDLLYDRIEHLTPEQAQAMAQGEASLMAYLAERVLLEGEHAETLRRQRYARHKAEVPPQKAPAIDAVDWRRVREWPDFVRPYYRDPEALRRLAEARAAGNPFIQLPGFLEMHEAHALAEAFEALSFEPMKTPWVSAERCLIDPDGPLRRWMNFLSDATSRELFGAILGRALGEGLVANAWRMSEGDGMPVHPDGRRYQGTITLGLSHNYSASQGGAIAFGTPHNSRFDVHARWLPHLGDLLLFAPTHNTWHAVEPVLGGRRRSLTAWWTA